MYGTSEPSVKRKASNGDIEVDSFMAPVSTARSVKSSATNPIDRLGVARRAASSARRNGKRREASRRATREESDKLLMA